MIEDSLNEIEKLKKIIPYLKDDFQKSSLYKLIKLSKGLNIGDYYTELLLKHVFDEIFSDDYSNMLHKRKSRNKEYDSRVETKYGWMENISCGEAEIFFTNENIKLDLSLGVGYQISAYRDYDDFNVSYIVVEPENAKLFTITLYINDVEIYLNKPIDSFSINLYPKKDSILEFIISNDNDRFLRKCIDD